MTTETNAALCADSGGVMARARNIKPGFFINEDLAELSTTARLLFIGLWCIADRDGRLEDRPKRIKMAILPADDCDVDALLSQLETRGFIVRYLVNQDESLQSFIQVSKWNKHQNPHHTERASVIPPCSDEAKALRQKQLSSLTVKEPSSSRECLADSLIHRFTDSPIQETLSVHVGPKKDMSSSAQKTAEHDASISQVFERWQKAMNKPRAKLDDKRRRLIRGAFAKGYTVADCIKAIDGCAASPWHMGQNDRGMAYNGIELIFRNAEKIDAFIGMADNPPALNRKLTRDEERAAAIRQLTGRIRREPKGGGNDPYTIDL